MKAITYKKDIKKRLFSELNLLTVSHIFNCKLTSKNLEKKLSLHTFCINWCKFDVWCKFSGFYTPQNPSKIGLIESFTYPSSSLWGIIISFLDFISFNLLSIYSICFLESLIIHFLFLLYKTYFLLFCLASIGVMP